MNPEITSPTWAFESAITTPQGLRVSVEVTVPQSQAWKDVGETAEIAQMCASQAATRAMNMIRESAERCPF
jgi:hypothetical protein